MTITIYHNPDCATSRNTLAMIRASGEEPVVIEYLKHPPTREKLESLIDDHPWIVYRVMRSIIRGVHQIQRRLSMQQAELSNYIFKQHGRY